MAINMAPLSTEERLEHYQDMRDCLNDVQTGLLQLADPVKGVRFIDQRNQVLDLYELVEQALSQASATFGPQRRES
jgi:hypothetical protein